MKRRFSEINAAIDGMEDIPDNVIIDRLNHLRNIEPHIDPRWGDLRGQANRIGRKLDAYLRISTDASRISDVHSDSDSDSEEIPLFSAAPQLLREWGQ
ncbi:MAG TPA: hypothetical protein VFS68_10050 [Candidatus Udaeobacter sp.]|nr:hypothetical protein [Candidatus Udaeobacter sp.]